MREKSVDGLVRVHVTLPKHGVDLRFRAVHDLLEALHQLPGPRRDRGSRRRSVPLAPRPSSTAAAAAAHPLLPSDGPFSCSFFFSRPIGVGKAGGGAVVALYRLFAPLGSQNPLRLPLSPLPCCTRIVCMYT